MRKIGLIGGMSWYSTMGYYRILNETVQARLGGHSSARLVLESLDFEEVRQCQLAGDWEGAGRLLAEAGRRCQDAGAEGVLICTNLMHKVAGDVRAAIDVPLLHIAEAVATRARADGHQRVGLLGTGWTMTESFYREPLVAAGLDVRTPGPADRELVDRIIFDELTRGIVTEASRAQYVRIIEDLVAAGAQAILLSCTEIELLVRPEDVNVPLLESMRVHAEAAADFSLTAASVPVG